MSQQAGPYRQFAGQVEGTMHHPIPFGDKNLFGVVRIPSVKIDAVDAETDVLACVLEDHAIAR